MSFRLGKPLHTLCLIALLVPVAGAVALSSWRGVLRDDAGKPVSAATVRLTSTTGDRHYQATTTAGGEFALSEMVAGEYDLSVESAGKTWRLAKPTVISDGASLNGTLQLSSPAAEVRILPGGEESAAQASGGERLSSGEVSSLPLNARDFSKLLLLAAGTMTDANGAANFTQQFAVNGQRGTTTVFALDGFDTTDPEMGGATFSNFNVDAIQEVQSNTGVMTAEIGHGAASFTNVVTKSGTNQVHGSFFEFARNAAFDARNYFDHKSVADERRIPPFVRNEFGFTNGGPVVLAENLRRPQPHFLFRTIPGLPPGAGHHAGVSRPDRRRTPGHRHRNFSRRHPDRPGEPGHRPGARSLSPAQRSQGGLRRSHLCCLVQDLHPHRPVFGAGRSPHFRQSIAIDPVQLQPGDRAADQSRPDGD